MSSNGISDNPGRSVLIGTVAVAFGTACGAAVATYIGRQGVVDGTTFLGIVAVIAIVLFFTFGVYAYRALPGALATPIIARLDVLQEQFQLPPEGCMRWEYFHAKVRALHQVIEADDFEPDLVLGVGRSGAVVAALLAVFIGNKRVLSIDRVYGEPGPDGTVHIHFEPTFDVIASALKGKQVLCVMSEKDSGRTLEALTRASQRITGISGFRTAVVFNNAEKAPPPNYYAVADSGQRAALPFRYPNEPSSSKVSK